MTGWITDMGTARAESLLSVIGDLEANPSGQVDAEALIAAFATSATADATEVVERSFQDIQQRAKRNSAAIRQLTRAQSWWRRKATRQRIAAQVAATLEQELAISTASHALRTDSFREARETLFEQQSALQEVARNQPSLESAVQEGLSRIAEALVLVNQLATVTKRLQEQDGLIREAVAVLTSGLAVDEAIKRITMAMGALEGAMTDSKTKR